jgi:uncharacterized metal-binding protein
MNNTSDVHDMTETGVLPCSGACNVGNMTVKAAGTLAAERADIQYVCALGLPLGIEGIISKAKRASQYVAMNGCEVACATKALQSIGIDPHKELCLTKDFSIKKSNDYQDEHRLSDVIERAKKIVDSFCKSSSTSSGVI